MTRLPNKNEHDACCRCGVILPTKGAWELTVASQLTGAQPVPDDVLLIHQPGPGDPPQFMCGKCSKEVAE